MYYRMISRLFSGLIFTTLLLGLNLFPVGDHVSELHAAVKDPRVKKAIKRGVEYLKKEISNTKQGYRSLAAYTLIKAGESVDSPAVAAAMKKVFDKISDGQYEPEDVTKAEYEAGVDIMLLAEAPEGRNNTQIEAIVQYLATRQKASGSWNYHTTSPYGDTSVVQYAILGLWAAHRSGVTIPFKVLEKSGQWHLSSQQKNGAFSYNPGSPDQNSPSLNMSLCGAGSMMVVQLILFEDQPTKEEKESESAAEKNKLLKKISLDEEKKKKKSNLNFHPTISNQRLSDAITKTSKWIDIQFRPKYPDNTAFRFMYYYYALERFGALSNVQKLDNQDWFNVCKEELLKTQQANGGWSITLVPTTISLLSLQRRIIENSAS